MTESLLSVLLNESRWIAPSMALALVLAARTLWGADRGDMRPVGAAMSIYAGAMVGTLAVGHLLAVTLGLGAGVIHGSPTRLYGIGIVLAAPSWWVFAHGRALGKGTATLGRPTVASNGAMVLALLAIGLPNIPLAIPAILNVGHASVRRKVVQKALASAAGVVALLLFVGSVVFFLSGQSFEDFSGV